MSIFFSLDICAQQVDHIIKFGVELKKEGFERIMCEGAVETLDALQSKGRRLGMISNNDGKCREKCEI